MATQAELTRDIDTIADRLSRFNAGTKNANSGVSDGTTNLNAEHRYWFSNYDVETFQGDVLNHFNDAKGALVRATMEYQRASLNLKQVQAPRQSRILLARDLRSLQRKMDTAVDEIKKLKTDVDDLQKLGNGKSWRRDFGTPEDLPLVIKAWNGRNQRLTPLEEVTPDERPAIAPREGPTESAVERDPNGKRYSPAQLAREAQDEEQIDRFIRREIPELRQLLSKQGVKDVGEQGLNSSMLWVARGIYARDKASDTARGYLFGRYLTENIEKIAKESIDSAEDEDASQSYVPSINWGKAIPALDRVKGSDITKRHVLLYFVGAEVAMRMLPPGPPRKVAASWANKILFESGAALPAAKGEKGSRPVTVNIYTDKKGIDNLFEKFNKNIWKIPERQPVPGMRP